MYVKCKAGPETALLIHPVGTAVLLAFRQHGLVIVEPGVD
jgi:hypothetical protein